MISPTEPPLLKQIGTVSSTPEKFGSDVLVATATMGAVGIQRKELSDFVASVHDGRLQRELAQMKNLGVGVVLLEGVPKWTEDGESLWTSSWTISQHLGTIWSIQSRGYWIATTSHLRDTCAYISTFTRWLAKSRHTSLNNRPNAKSVWGSVNNRDWGIHLLQSFNGLGYDLAAAIYDHFGGVPVQWTVTELDLQQVPGIGQKRSQTIIEALDRRDALKSALRSRTDHG